MSIRPMRLGFLLSPPNPGAATAGSHGRPDSSPSSPLRHLLPTPSKLQLGADRGFSSPSARSWRSRCRPARSQRRRLSGRGRGLPQHGRERCRLSGRERRGRRGRGLPQRERERCRCSGRERGGRRGRGLSRSGCCHGPARRHCSGRERGGHRRRRHTGNGLPGPAARHAGASPLPAMVGPPGSPLYPLPPGRRWRVPSPAAATRAAAVAVALLAGAPAAAGVGLGAAPVGAAAAPRPVGLHPTSAAASLDPASAIAAWAAIHGRLPCFTATSSVPLSLDAAALLARAMAAAAPRVRPLAAVPRGTAPPPPPPYSFSSTVNPPPAAPPTAGLRPVSPDWIADSGATSTPRPMRVYSLLSVLPTLPVPLPSSIMVAHGTCIPVSSVGTASSHGSFHILMFLWLPVWFTTSSLFVALQLTTLVRLSLTPLASPCGIWPPGVLFSVVTALGLSTPFVSLFPLHLLCLLIHPLRHLPSPPPPPLRGTIALDIPVALL